MLLINEIKKIRHNFLNNSSLSLKEKAFYHFLVDNPLDYPTENNLAEIEQICLSVFGGDLLLKKELITTHRKMQPIHRMHYRNNLIELVAMATDNLELERNHLKSYCENCSTRDFYILNNLFPNISSNPPQPQGSIDQIALHLYGGNFPEKDWKSLLLNALYETSDLIDFFVIEKGFQQAMDDHPIVYKVNAIRYIREVLDYAIEKTERRVKFIIVGVGTLLLVPVLKWSIPLIKNSWAAAEPIIAILGFLLPLLTGLFAFAGIAPDKAKLFSVPREKIIDWVFTWNGLNRAELKKKLDILNK